jgi:hypothetical protein
MPKAAHSPMFLSGEVEIVRFVASPLADRIVARWSGPKRFALSVTQSAINEPGRISAIEGSTQDLVTATQLGNRRL